MRDLTGRVAVVTGAASGIGHALATKFAESGMRVVLADVEAHALEAAVARLNEQGHAEVLGVPTDVSSPESVEALAAKTIEAFGGVHVLCNNAGVGAGFGRIWEATLKDWQWTLGVNVWGVIHGVRTFVPLMLERGEEGHIVNTASVAGLTPATRVYSVSKHAVVAISEALYHNLRDIDAPLGVSVLCPGLINTQIMFAYRNRPADLQNQAGVQASEGELARSERIHNLADELGMPPAQVATRVADAILRGEFYILTHDEFDVPIRTRVEDILERRLPTPYRSQLDQVSQR